MLSLVLLNILCVTKKGWGISFGDLRKWERFLKVESYKLRVGRDLKGHLAPPPIWCLNHLNSLPAKWSLLNYFMTFLKKDTESSSEVLEKKIHLRIGNPAVVTSWSIWFLILSCNIFILQFLVIYKFAMPAFCVSSMFLIEISRSGIEHWDMTYRNHPPMVSWFIILWYCSANH